MQRKTKEKDRSGKVEDMKIKRQKRIGSEKTKIKNVCFIQTIDNNKGKKEENDRTEVCTIYLCWRDNLERLR